MGDGSGVKKINDELIKVLSIWGDDRAGRVRGLECLSYPSSTPENRLLTSPGRSETKGFTPGYFPNRTAKWVERKLQGLEARYRNFLWCNYVQQMKEADAVQAMGCESVYFYRTSLTVAHEKSAKLLNIRYYIYI